MSERPASGDGSLRFSDRLRTAAEPAWTAAVDHRFVHELADDALDDAVFRRYLVQDYAFIETLVGLVGFAIGEAPTMTSKARLAGFLGVLTDDENDYFERSFEALSVPRTERSDPDRTATSAALEDLLCRVGREGYPEILAVLLPAEWIYLTWASGVDTTPDRFYLREWIDLHANEEFESFVGWLRDELDGQAAELGERRRDRVRRHFRRTVELEEAFFDAAYAD